MEISYVIPVYNGVAVIAETIESLLRQKHKDYEIIVVDDASTDEIDLLKDFYVGEYKQIIWVQNEERKGAAYCRNVGNSLALGDIIAVCDAGDYYMANRGSELVKFFSENEDKDLVYSHVQCNAANGDILYTQEAVEWDGNGKPPISHPTVAYRKRLVNNIQYFESSLETDFYEFFMIDAFRDGYKFGFIPRILCVKTDLAGSENYRDVKGAKEEKRKRYEEYGIEVKHV